MNCYLIVVEWLECQSDLSSCVVGSDLTLVGPPKANWSQVRGQTQCDSKDSYEKKKINES